LPVQFFHYAVGLLTFDLGWSPRSNATVASVILARLPATLLLAGGALVCALLFGVLLGVIASRRPNSLTDNAISVVSLVAYAVPVFWLGLMLVVVFSINLGWLPTGGYRSLDRTYTGLAYALDVGRHALLPVLTLSLFYTAIYARLMRASMLEVAGLDYVRTARAKGLSERRVLYGHVLRNALLPIATMIGIHLGAMLGGAVVVEMVYSWPGLGRLAFEAIMSRDLNLLLGILFLSSLLVVAINILMDIVYVALDPRINVK
jgi:peptide/nickel transport system permease protein